MDPLQLLLIATGLLIAVGGVALLVKSLRGSEESSLKPYVPFATIAVGIAIAYRSFTDFNILDGQDITIMFVFVLGLASLLGLQFLVVDRHKPRVDPAVREEIRPPDEEGDRENV